MGKASMSARNNTVGPSPLRRMPTRPVPARLKTSQP